MIKIFKYTIIFLIYLSIIINHSKSSENKILFKVNNEIITSLDILNELQYLQIINKEFKNIKKEKAFQISKNSLIREKIKEIEIKRIFKEFKIKDNILNNLILNYFKEFKITSIPEFEKFFLNNDVDPNIIRKKIKLEMLWNQLIYRKYQKNVKINNLDKIKFDNANLLFHAGTISENDTIKAVGGRVLNFVSLSDDFGRARKKIIESISKLNWSGGFFRKDIGYKVID